MKKRFINAKRFINWPIIINGLTISRILIGLPIIISLNNGNNEVFIFLILLGGLTDYLDGYFARKYDHKSAFGAKLDPLADKILLIGPMIWLVHENLVPLWAVWLIISRELLITSWRSDKTSGGPASIQGKYKTTLLPLLSEIIIGNPINILEIVSPFIITGQLINLFALKILLFILSKI